MKAKLGEVCSSIYDGDHSAPPKSESGIPFVTITNIDASDGTVDFSDTAFVPEEYYDSLKAERKPRLGDVLYSVVGSFGIPSLVKSNKRFVFQRHIAILRPSERIDSTYLYYVLKDASFYHWADAVAIGSAQRTVTLGQLRNKEVDLPDLETQRRITGVLSAYDKLIENNRKQIKLLEEAAQRLYKEWFVDLKFPGHETIPIVNGLPEGWEKKMVDEVFCVSIGKTPPRKETQWFSHEGMAWASVSDLGKCDSFLLKTAECLTEEAIDRFNVKVVPEGTILLSFKMTIGRVAIAANDMCTNEAIAHFKTNDAYLIPYAYGYFSNYEYNSLGSTSSISTAINSKIVKAMPFVVPSQDVLLKYNRLSSPLLNESRVLSQQIAAAREARDRLLPKLMSGEIEV